MIPEEYESYNWFLEIKDLVNQLPIPVLMELSQLADGRENLPLWDMVIQDRLYGERN